MTWSVGARVRLIETGKRGVVVHSYDYSSEIEFLGDESKYEQSVGEDEVIDDSLDGRPIIVRSLQFGVTGGLYWEEAYNQHGYGIGLAYAWSDGVVTWTEWRDFEPEPKKVPDATVVYNPGVIRDYEKSVDEKLKGMPR